MSTYTTTNVTRCDECGEVVPAGWRHLAAHTANHQRAHQLAARQARIDAATRAQTRCNTPRFDLNTGVETTILKGTNEAAPDMSPEPPLHPDLAEYKVKSSARQAVPPLTFRGVA